MVKENLKQQILKLEESITKQKEQLENLTLIFIPPTKVKEEANKRQGEINNLLEKRASLEEKKAYLEKRYKNIKLLEIIDEHSWLYKKFLKYIRVNIFRLLFFEIILIFFILLLTVKALGTQAIINNRFGFFNRLENEFMNAFVEWFMVETILLWGFSFLFIPTIKWIKSEKVLKFLSVISLIFLMVVLFTFTIIIMI